VGLAGLYSRVGSDTIDFRFRFQFSAESPSLLSVAHTVSAECDASLSAYFRLRPKVEFPLSVDLYITIVHFLPARRYASAGLWDRNVSVSLSVRHEPVLCQNEES